MVNYRLTDLSLLDTGGTSAVYKARCSPPFAGFDTVAVKILDPKTASDPDALNRFLEGEVACQREVDDRNVVRYLDMSVSDEELGEGCTLAYLVVEHVDGLPLDKLMDSWCTGAPAPRFQRLAIFRQALSGVASIHRSTRSVASGLVHRDIAPKNIVVGHSMTADAVKVADFGLAKFLRGRESVAPASTSKGWASYPYAPPEQVLAPHHVTQSADVHALGVTLVELLWCGPGTPHDEHRLTVLGDLITEIRKNGAHKVFRSLAHQREASEWCISRGLANLIDKALKKEPSARFQNAKQMLRAFDQAMAEQWRPFSTWSLIAAGIAILAVMGLWVHTTVAGTHQKSSVATTSPAHPADSVASIVRPPTPTTSNAPHVRQDSLAQPAGMQRRQADTPRAQGATVSSPAPDRFLVTGSGDIAFHPAPRLMAACSANNIIRATGNWDAPHVAPYAPILSCTDGWVTLPVKSMARVRWLLTPGLVYCAVFREDVAVRPPSALLVADTVLFKVTGGDQPDAVLISSNGEAREERCRATAHN